MFATSCPLKNPFLKRMKPSHCTIKLLGHGVWMPHGMTKAEPNGQDKASGISKRFLADEGFWMFCIQRVHTRMTMGQLSDAMANQSAMLFNVFLFIFF